MTFKDRARRRPKPSAICPRLLALYARRLELCSPEQESLHDVLVVGLLMGV